MILRLFLVPFLIVGVLVAIYLLGHTFFGSGGRRLSTDHYLKNLDNTNPDIRWRAASDLSQELPRSPEMARDAAFALELAERLERALDDSATAEADFLARLDKLAPAEKERILNKELAPHRNLIMYLGAGLGNFQVPVGVPLLRRLATHATGMEPDALAERRGRALFALAVLGDNLRKYDALADELKDRIDTELTAAASSESHGRLARLSLDYLKARRDGSADSFGVVPTLELCADEEDPYLRELTALASNFWTGTPDEQRRLDTLLAKLAVDDGRGHDLLDQRQERNPEAKRSRALCKRPGFQVQINANLALARRGSDRVRLPLLVEQLDPALLRQIFVVRQRGRDGEREVPDEALVVVTLTTTLQAIADLHRRQPRANLDPLRDRIEALAKDENVALRTEAEKTLQALKPG